MQDHFNGTKNDAEILALDYMKIKTTYILLMHNLPLNTLALVIFEFTLSV